MSLGTILLIVLILMLIGVFPSWPHSKSWGYGPSGGVGLGGNHPAHTSVDGCTIGRWRVSALFPLERYSIASQALMSFAGTIRA